MGIINTSKEQKDPLVLDADLVAVEVYTTAGAFPTKGHELVKITEIVGEILSKAGSTLKLTDTSNWNAQVDGRDVDPSKSYEANELKGTITIHWGPREGGGGC